MQWKPHIDATMLRAVHAWYFSDHAYASFKSLFLRYWPPCVYYRWVTLRSFWWFYLYSNFSITSFDSIRAYRKYAWRITLHPAWLDIIMAWFAYLHDFMWTFTKAEIEIINTQITKCSSPIINSWLLIQSNLWGALTKPADWAECHNEEHVKIPKRVIFLFFYLFLSTLIYLLSI